MLNSSNDFDSTKVKHTFAKIGPGYLVANDIPWVIRSLAWG